MVLQHLNRIGLPFGLFIGRLLNQDLLGKKLMGVNYSAIRTAALMSSLSVIYLTYLLTYLLTYVFTYLLAYLLTYLLACLLTCLLTYLHTYLLTYLLTN